MFISIALMILIYKGSDTYFFNGLGLVKTNKVEVFLDVECTQKITSIDWGNLISGSFYEKNIFIKNFNDKDIILSMYTDNWDPKYIMGSIIISWNQEGSIISPNQVISTILKLEISPKIKEVNYFSFDIIIEGTTIPSF